MYDISWINVKLMLADQQRYESKAKKKSKKLSLEQYFEREKKKQNEQQ